MKIFIFILTILIAIQSQASVEWFPVGKDGVKTKYIDNKSLCESKEGQECFDITGKNPAYHDAQTSEVDDLSKPIYKAKYNSKNCDSDTKCADKIAEGMQCLTGDYAEHKKNSLLPGFTVYCIGVDSYEKKTVKTLVENTSKKTAYEADKAAKATETAMYDAVKNNMAFGEKMIAFVSVRNIGKGLKKAQKKRIVQDYSLINDLFRAGAIETAKDEITAITPDGVRVTEADKAAILAEINAYLGK